MHILILTVKHGFIIFLITQIQHWKKAFRSSTCSRVQTSVLVQEHDTSAMFFERTLDSDSGTLN